MAPADDPAEHYALAANPLPRGGLPRVLIPTTAGTGSEVTRTSVFTSSDGRKLWAWGEGLRADLAILDPTLTVALPPLLTAATAVDAMVHAIEACTVKRGNPVADAHGLHAIRILAADAGGAKNPLTRALVRQRPDRAGRAGPSRPCRGRHATRGRDGCPHLRRSLASHGRKARRIRRLDVAGQPLPR